MNMKKFRLKPLRELQQKFSMNWFFIGLVMALSVSACSDDDDEVTPTFPAKQTIDTNADKTHEFTFDAGANWQLTSSAIWCRFVVDGEEEYSLSGNAGKQTITLKITDEAQKFDARTTAQLTLMMGENKAIIADVVRNAKGRELKIYDENGNEIEKIEVGYDDYKSFIVKANFRFAATNRPEWLEIAGNAIVGSASDQKGVTGKVKVVTDPKYSKYEQTGGTITFADDEGLASYTIPLVYKGMDRDDIVVTAPTANKWNWVVSLDGKTFSQEGSSGASASTSTTTYKNGLPFTIQAYNDEFTTVYIEDYKGSFTPDAYDWIELKGQKGNMRLVVTPSDRGERIGYVLSFPNQVYDEIKDNLIGNIMQNGEIKYEYEQKYLLIQFTQKDKGSSSEVQFTATNAQTAQPIECTEYTGDNASHFKNTYNVKTTYEIKEPATSNNINALFTIANFKCYNLEDESVDTKNVCEQTDESTINAYIKDIKNDIFITVFDSEGNGKMMIVRASNQGGGTSTQPFTVTNNSLQPVECSAYSGGDLGYLKSEYGVSAVYEIKQPAKSMYLNTTSSFSITEYQCYYFENFDPAPSDICTLPDGTWSPFNMWIDGIMKDICVVISNGADQKYMVVVRINN